MALTEFLLARIAEDEAVARRAQGLAPGRWRSRQDTATRVLIERVSSRPLGSVAVLKWAQAEEAEHIARHDPDRVLAECEAKRLIVAVCSADLEARGEGALEGMVDRATWDVLAAMAAVYADHPDYREEWRP